MGVMHWQVLKGGRTGHPYPLAYQVYHLDRLVGGFASVSPLGSPVIRLFRTQGVGTSAIPLYPPNIGHRQSSLEATWP